MARLAGIRRFIKQKLKLIYKPGLKFNPKISKNYTFNYTNTVFNGGISL